MTRLACKLFLDECISPAIIESYFKPHLDLLELTAEVKHFKEKFGRGSRYKDRDFVPILAREPDWIIISSDRAKQCKKVDSLVELCRLCAVSLVCVTTPIMERGVPYLGARIIAHWDALVSSVKPRGGHFHIRMAGHDTADTIFRAVRCPYGYVARKERCVKDLDHRGRARK